MTDDNTNCLADYPLTKGLEDVLRERILQLHLFGFTETHDDQYNMGELVRASIAYLQSVIDPKIAGCRLPPPSWPSWGHGWWRPNPGNPRKDLVKAAAMLIAEIERRDRLEDRKEPM